MNNNDIFIIKSVLSGIWVISSLIWAGWSIGYFDLKKMIGSYLDKSRGIDSRYASLKLIQHIKNNYLHEVETQRQYQVKKYKNNPFIDTNDIWIMKYTESSRNKLNQLMVKIFNNRFGIDPQDLQQLNSIVDDISRTLKINKEQREKDR